MPSSPEEGNPPDNRDNKKKYPIGNAKKTSKPYTSSYGIGTGTVGVGEVWGTFGTPFDQDTIAINREKLERVRKWIEHERNKIGISTNGSTKTLEDVVKQLRGSKFYCWEFGDGFEAHHRHAASCNNTCCAVYMIGVPENKPGLPRGFFPYEKTVFDALQVHSNIWIKKATGLGISEFFLYYFFWLACKDDSLKDKRICFITGPRIELTVMLMDRLKNLPILRETSFYFKNTVFEINGVKFEAFPSNNLDSARGLDRVAWWMMDEADFWELSLQEEARTIAERYWGKSQVRIVMISTPGMPNGLFDKIEHEQDSAYYKIFLHWTQGLGYIYTKEDIARAKKSPSFPREYGLEYLGTEGDVFIQEEIERAVQLGETVNWQTPQLSTLKSMGIDPGFSKSSYAIVITSYNPTNKMIEIIYASQFPHASPAEMTKKAWDLIMRFNVTCVFIDASQNGPIRDLKYAWGERWRDYEEHVKEVRAEGRNLAERMRVIPVGFDPHTGGEMISKCQQLFSLGKIAIPSVFRDLTAQLRSATMTPEGKLDKKSYGTMDLFDAFRLAIFYYIPYQRATIAYRSDPHNPRNRTGIGGIGHNDIFR